jgi:two-component system sensor histidine kinase AlgZ
MAHRVPDGMPDLRNPGVIGRVIVIVHLMLAAGAAISPLGWIDALVEAAVVIEPVLLASLVLGYLLAPGLSGLRSPWWQIGASLVVVALALAMNLLVASVPGLTEVDGTRPVGSSPWRTALLAVLAVNAIAEYLRLRNQALSPASAEARLQSLQSRIRPHFLFNSLTAVLSLIHVDPHRAEQVLEDLADLFRSLMSDSTRLVPLSRELDLVREYLRIESLRLGERLQCHIEVDPAALDALVPSLMLQPLVENAIYHGIEPSPVPARVLIEVRAQGSRLAIRIANPLPPAGSERQGNGMALGNIRERLSLHFDAQASLWHGATGGRYEVRLALPRREPASEGPGA